MATERGYGNVPRSVACVARCFSQGKNRQIFVGLPLEKPTAWVRINQLDSDTLLPIDGQRIPLTQVKSILVAYDNGEILDCVGLFSPLPEGVHFLQDSEQSATDILEIRALDPGKRHIKVTFGPSTSRPKRTDYYSTTLTRVSNQRIRVLRFGAYQKRGERWVLSTITGGFFTAEQFRSWYGMGTQEWLNPGQQVADPDNYGAPPVIWAYYCETESGEQFIAGGLLE